MKNIEKLVRLYNERNEILVLLDELLVDSTSISLRNDRKVLIKYPAIVNRIHVTTKALLQSRLVDIEKELSAAECKL